MAQLKEKHEKRPAEKTHQRRVSWVRLTEQVYQKYKTQDLETTAFYILSHVTAPS